EVCMLRMRHLCCLNPSCNITMAVPDAVKAHLALALVQFNYGVYHVISKVALSDGVNQLVFCAFRDLIALAILAPSAYLVERGQRPPLNRHVLLSLIALGFTGVFANQTLFLLGLGFTSPSYASALQPGIPVFTFALTLCMGTEHIHWRQWSGLAKVGGTAVCILGAIFMAVYNGPVIWGDGLIGVHIPPPKMDGLMLAQIEHLLSALNLSLWHIGVLCLIGNCFFMALYLSLQAPLLKKYPAGISLTAYSYFFGTVFIILSALACQSGWNDWVLTESELLAVIFCGIVASALNYGLLTWSNKVLGPALVALYMPLQPVFSSILAGVFLSSSLYLGSVVGGCFVVAGLYCVTWGQMRSVESAGTDHDKGSMGSVVEEVNSLESLEDPLLKERSIRRNVDLYALVICIFQFTVQKGSGMMYRLHIRRARLYIGNYQLCIAEKRLATASAQSGPILSIDQRFYIQSSSAMGLEPHGKL
ncbi:hypothetical protein GOP47_0020875, partial [Adiantum capillus-veneris]